MRKTATGGIQNAYALGIGRYGVVFDDLLVLGNVVFVLVEPIFGLLGDNQGLDTTGSCAAQGGEQSFGAHVKGLQHAVHSGFDGFVVLAIGHQYLSEGAGFHGLFRVAGSLKPGITVGVTHLGEVGLGFAFIRHAGFVAFVPAVAHMFFDLAGVKCLHSADLAIIDDTGLVPAAVKVAFTTSSGELAKSHEVVRTAKGSPVFVLTSHHEQIGNVDLFNEGAGLLVQFAEFLDALGGQGFVAGHAASNGELGVRVFGAEHGHTLGNVHLGAQGFQIVGSGNQVGFGFKVVAGMPAEEVGIGEGAELAAFNKGLQFGLHGGKVFSLGRAGRNGLGKLGSLGRVGLQGVGHIHKVKRVQMIKMHQMVMHKLHGHDQVADVGGVGRNGLVDSVFKCACRGKGVRVGADAAGALGEVLSITRIAALQDNFKAAEKRATAAGVFDFAAFNFDFNTQMPFDAGQRVHHNGPGVVALGRLFDLAHDSP